MNRIFLIFLALILPLQPIVAAERGLHALEGKTPEIAMRHMQDHVEHIAHHHDDHGDLHEDDSQASTQHLFNFDLTCASHAIVPDEVRLSCVLPTSVKLLPYSETFTSCSSSPPHRPPYVPA